MFVKSKSAPAKPASSRGIPGSTEASVHFMNLPLKEKQKHYICRERFKTLLDLNIYSELVKFNRPRIQQLADRNYRKERNDRDDQFEPSEKLNEKVCLHQGDITALEIGAIVNAANRTLLGGGGVDGAIHKAAGSTLVEECELLNGCSTGHSKITGGHKLPASYVIHTVGPTNRSESALISCYETCLQLVLDYKIRSVAFCCIATGIYGYPNRDAAHVALLTVRRWLEQHHDKVDRIIFCTFLEIDFDSYLELMATRYFPVPSKSTTGDKLKESKEMVDESSRNEKNRTERDVEKDRNSEKQPTETENIGEPGDGNTMETVWQQKTTVDDNKSTKPGNESETSKHVPHTDHVDPKNSVEKETKDQEENLNLEKDCEMSEDSFKDEKKGEGEGESAPAATDKERETSENKTDIDTKDLKET